MLQCEVTTVRGITSSVSIVWSSDGLMLNSMNDMSPTTMDNSVVYTTSYTIPQPLSTTDDGKVFQCEVIIDASTSVMASSSITLDVIGE